METARADSLAFVQRLFSTFPGSWPGLGLLILRITVGLSPFVVLTLPLDDMTWRQALFALAALLSVCVVVGAATPLASPALAVMVILASRHEAWGAWLALVGASTSLMLVGPGAWSVDALLYGRKRIPMD